MSWNEDLLRFINEDMANPGLDVFFSILIILGTVYVWLVFVPALWWKGKRNEAVDMFFLIVLVLVVTTVLKFLFASPRPEDIREVPIPVPGYFGLDVYSFPSNHASRAFACAIFLSFRFRKWAVPLFVYAFLMGLAKIYVGAHYPTDILGGAFLGVFFGWFVVVSEKHPLYRDMRKRWFTFVEGFEGRWAEYRACKSKLRELYETLCTRQLPRGPWEDVTPEDEERDGFFAKLVEYDGYLAGLISTLSLGPDVKKQKMLVSDLRMREDLNRLIDRFGEKDYLLAYREYLDFLDELVGEAVIAVEKGYGTVDDQT